MIEIFRNIFQGSFKPVTPGFRKNPNYGQSFLGHIFLRPIQATDLGFFKYFFKLLIEIFFRILIDTNMDFLKIFFQTIDSNLLGIFFKDP